MYDLSGNKQLDDLFLKIKVDNWRVQYCQARNIKYKVVIKNGNIFEITNRNNNFVEDLKKTFTLEENYKIENPIFVICPGNGTSYWAIDLENKKFRYANIKEALTLGADLW